jgi:hypothetical protein
METLNNIFAIAAGVFALAAMLILPIFEKKKWAMPAALTSFVLFMACLMAGIYTQNTIEGRKPKEFPAKDYTFETKVTYFQGRSDTTYVITLKR